MSTLRIIAAVLQNAGFLLYGGPIVAFAVLVAAAPRIPGIAPWEIVRTYRSWGAGMGLSLGACILGLLGGRWLDYGAFSWPSDTPSDQLVLAGTITFLVMWASNLVLEVWTLEPLRKLDRNGAVTDEPAYRAATARLARHLVVQAALVLAVLVLATISAS